MSRGKATAVLLLLLSLVAGLVLLPPKGRADQKEAKLALVFGVSSYKTAPAEFMSPAPLPNAANDARLVAKALESKGFIVRLVIDPYDKTEMIREIDRFGGDLSSAGEDAVGVVYFAGHGAQGRPNLSRDIDNYLIPTNVRLKDELSLDSEAVPLRYLSERVRPATRGAVIFIMDACRDFALPQASTRTMQQTRGLAEAKARPGTYIAYSTAPGAVSFDGPPGGNGVYAKALADEIRAAQGTRIEDIFISVRSKVQREVPSQVPWESASLQRAVSIGDAPRDILRLCADVRNRYYADFQNISDQRLAGKIEGFRSAVPAECPDVRDLVDAKLSSLRVDPCAGPTTTWGAISSICQPFAFEAFLQQTVPQQCAPLRTLISSRIDACRTSDPFAGLDPCEVNALRWKTAKAQTDLAFLRAYRDESKRLGCAAVVSASEERIREVQCINAQSDWSLVAAGTNVAELDRVLATIPPFCAVRQQATLRRGAVDAPCAKARSALASLSRSPSFSAALDAKRVAPDYCEAERALLDGRIREYQRICQPATTEWSIVRNASVGAMEGFLSGIPGECDPLMLDVKTSICRAWPAGRGTKPAYCVGSGARQTAATCPECPELITIPGGSFLMGSPATEKNRDEDEGVLGRATQKEISVPSFYLGKYEVTNREWEACVQSGRCPVRDRSGGANAPVVGVTWLEAVEYTNFLNDRLGLSASVGYRLPTEAEWEFAARAGGKGPYGHTEPASICQAANITGCNQRPALSDVGLRDPNALGLHDMIGNVQEWVNDCYVASLAQTPANGGSAPESTDCNRAFRGGSYLSDRVIARVANRGFDRSNSSSVARGFRVARSQ